MSDAIPLKLNADRVRQIREEHGVGLMEARRILQGELLRDALQSTDDIRAIKVVITAMILDLYPLRPRKRT
jgi:hypothetical protein